MLTSRAFIIVGLAASLAACNEMATGVSPEQALSAAELAVAGVTNLSGTWKLDPSQSQFPAVQGGRPQGGKGRRPAGGAAFDGTLTISQSATTITINKMTIKTDGSVNSGGAGAPTGVSATAQWTDVGLKIVRKTPHGMELTELVSVSSDGLTLTAAISGGPAGKGGKRVFKRA